MTIVSFDTRDNKDSASATFTPTPCKSLTIVVSGVPVPQARHRDRVVQTGGRVRIQRYTPAETVAWNKHILRAARATPGFPDQPWDGAVRVTIDAYFPRTKEQMRKSAPDGPIRKNTKPDADNIAKSVCDALTPPRMKRRCDNEAIRAAYKRGYLWHDDGQVHLGQVNRWYHAKGAGPGLIVLVERIPDGQ